MGSCYGRFFYERELCISRPQLRYLIAPPPLTCLSIKWLCLGGQSNAFNRYITSCRIHVASLRLKTLNKLEEVFFCVKIIKVRNITYLNWRLFHVMIRCWVNTFLFANFCPLWSNLRRLFFPAETNRRRTGMTNQKRAQPIITEQLQHDTLYSFLAIPIFYVRKKLIWIRSSQFIY